MLCLFDLKPRWPTELKFRSGLVIRFSQIELGGSSLDICHAPDSDQIPSAAKRRDVPSADYGETARGLSEFVRLLRCS
jgi:hypothetical protein